jgi:hypothetical protein
MTKEVNFIMQDIYNNILEIRWAISKERETKDNSNVMFTNVCMEILEENFEKLDLLLKK